MPIPRIDELLAVVQFDGMPRPESAVLKLWLQKHGMEFDAIAFNVRMGEGATPHPSLSEATKAQAKLLTQKRADCIVWSGGYPVIIEVKQRIGLGALGQLTGYKHLFERENPGVPSPQMRAIGYYADNDVVRVLTAHGVTIELFPRVGS